MRAPFQWRLWGLVAGCVVMVVSAMNIDSVRHRVREWKIVQRVLGPANSSAMRIHREERLAHFKGLFPVPAGAVLMIGDSLVEEGAWFELFGASAPVLNQGISGDTVRGLAERLQVAVDCRPKTVVMVIGINDLLAGKLPSDLVPEIAGMVRQLRKGGSTVVVHEVLPVNADLNSRLGIAVPRIEEMNGRLKGMAADEGASFMTVGVKLLDPAGSLERKYTRDGLHLSATGYLQWRSEILDQWSRLPLDPWPDK